MSLIPCSSNCIYCEDGYCRLETAALVSNTGNEGCIHCIKQNAADSSAADNDDRSIQGSPSL